MSCLGNLCETFVNAIQSCFGAIWGAINSTRPMHQCGLPRCWKCGLQKGEAGSSLSFVHHHLACRHLQRNQELHLWMLADMRQMSTLLAPGGGGGGSCAAAPRAPGVAGGSDGSSAWLPGGRRCVGCSLCPASSSPPCRSSAQRVLGVSRGVVDDPSSAGSGQLEPATACRCCKDSAVPGAE